MKQEEHLKSLSECIENDDSCGYPLNMVASESSLIITLKHMKEFLDYTNSHYHWSYTNKCYWKPNEYGRNIYYTTQQLIEQYINQL